MIADEPSTRPMQTRDLAARPAGWFTVAGGLVREIVSPPPIPSKGGASGGERRRNKDDANAASLRRGRVRPHFSPASCCGGARDHGRRGRRAVGPNSFGRHRVPGPSGAVRMNSHLQQGVPADRNRPAGGDGEKCGSAQHGSGWFPDFPCGGGTARSGQGAAPTRVSRPPPQPLRGSCRRGGDYPRPPRSAERPGKADHGRG